MKKRLSIFVVSLLCLSLTDCGGCSRQNDHSWLYSSEEEYYGDEENPADYGYETDDNTMQSHVEVEIPQGVTLAEAGREVYSDLLYWENNYNLGGIKLCTEMSADRQGKWVSSFWQNTTVSFYPPPDLHLHKIFVTDSSSNIICRIVNGEINVRVANVQNDIYRTNTEQPAFIVNITTINRTADSIPIVIPLGQMLEVQASDVQNIVVCNTCSSVLEPYQSKTFSVRAYCGAEKRSSPANHTVKLTPFMLTAPAYAYNSQSSLWNFQKTEKANDKIYTITFYGWGRGDNTGGTKSSIFGHAFVNIPEIGTVGFGANKEELKDLFMVYVEGNLSDHTKLEQYAKYKISIRIDEYSLRKAQKKYYEWKNDSIHYTLGLYDCTAFAMDIADAAEIYYGPRWTIQTPVGFLRELKVYNK